MNIGWREIDIRGFYSLVKIAFAPLCACKNNQQIWHNNASTLYSCDIREYSEYCLFLSLVNRFSNDFQWWLHHWWKWFVKSPHSWQKLVFMVTQTLFYVYWYYSCAFCHLDSEMFKWCNIIKWHYVRLNTFIRLLLPRLCGTSKCCNIIKWYMYYLQLNPYDFYYPGSMRKIYTLPIHRNIISLKNVAAFYVILWWLNV